MLFLKTVSYHHKLIPPRRIFLLYNRLPLPYVASCQKTLSQLDKQWQIIDLYCTVAADGESESFRDLKATNYKKEAGQEQTNTPHPCVQDWRKKQNPTRVDSKIHIGTEGTTEWSDRMIWRLALERCEIASRIRDNGEEHNAKRYKPLLVNAHEEAADGTTCRRWGLACWRERWMFKRDCWRKSYSGHMKESCKRQKWAPSRISFVKISAGLIRLGTCRICK